LEREKKLQEKKKIKLFFGSKTTIYRVADPDPDSIRDRIRIQEEGKK
jgi:hypothetical protein